MSASKGEIVCGVFLPPGVDKARYRLFRWARQMRGLEATQGYKRRTKVGR